MSVTENVLLLLSSKKNPMKSSSISELLRPKDKIWKSPPKGGVDGFHRHIGSVLGRLRTAGLVTSIGEVKNRGGSWEISPLGVSHIVKLNSGLRKCSRCGKYQDIGEFNVRKDRGSDHFSPICRECLAEKALARYYKNKSRYLRNIAQRRKELIEWLDVIKSKSGCSKCGEKRPKRLTFVRPLGSKSSRISTVVCQRCSKERILSEIKECSIICANCLQKGMRSQRDSSFASRYNELKALTKERLTQYRQRLRKGQEILMWLDELKSKTGCLYCKETDPRCLQFHHPLSNKEQTISHMARRRFSKDKIMLEVKKCQVVCAGCHSEIHLIKEV